MSITLTMIVAVTDELGIGKDGKIPWNAPKELQHFQQHTSGRPIIMGRKTFESLPSILRKRHHIVITSQDREDIPPDSKTGNPGVTFVKSPAEAVAVAEKYINGRGEAMVIGGGAVYNYFVPYCNRLIISNIPGNYETDTALDADIYDFFQLDEIKVMSDHIDGSPEKKLITVSYYSVKSAYS